MHSFVYLPVYLTDVEIPVLCETLLSTGGTEVNKTKSNPQRGCILARGNRFKKEKKHIQTLYFSEMHATIECPRQCRSPEGTPNSARWG